MIYEYRCGGCKQVSEFNMKLSDPHPELCPLCAHKGEMERIISKTSFALKGSGWYTTDYKKPTASASSTSSACSSGGGDSGGCASGACGAN